MADRRKVTGRRGETIAADYLRSRGYGIIAANWRCRLGEIDLVALDGPTLVFVEVRTRRSSIDGLAEESITPAKQRRLGTLSAAYLQQQAEAATPWSGPWRIDVVAIRIDPAERIHIHHLPYAVADLS